MRTISLRFFPIATSSLFLAAGVPSRPALGATLSLSESIERSWRSSPAIAQQLNAQTELYRAAEADVSERFVPNDPVVQYGTNDDHASEQISITEVVGLPGKALALSRLDRARRDALHAEIQAKKYDLALRIADSYLDVAVVVKLIDQQRRNIEDLEALEKSLTARYQAGMATQAETIVTDLQLRQVRADLRALEDHAAVAESHLRSALDLPAGESLSLDLPDDIDARLIGQFGDETSNEVRSQANLDLAKANRAVAFWNELPDVSLGVARNRYLFLPASPVGARVTKNYAVGVSLPIDFPWHGRNDIRRQKNQALLDASGAELDRIEAQRQRDEAAREYERSRDRLKELREHDLPYAEALMESTFSSYRSGKLGFAELVLARKTLMDLRAQDIQLRAAVIGSHLRCLKREGV